MREWLSFLVLLCVFVSCVFCLSLDSFKQEESFTSSFRFWVATGEPFIFCSPFIFDLLFLSGCKRQFDNLGFVLVVWWYIFATVLKQKAQLLWLKGEEKKFSRSSLFINVKKCANFMRHVKVWKSLAWRLFCKMLPLLERTYHFGW